VQDATGKSSLEDHAIATYALVKCALLSSMPEPLVASAQSAIGWLDLNGDPQAFGFTPATAAWRVLVNAAVDARAQAVASGRADGGVLKREPARDDHLRMWVVRRARGPLAPGRDVATAAELICRWKLMPTREDPDPRLSQQVAHVLAQGLDGDEMPDPRYTMFVTHALIEIGSLDVKERDKDCWRQWSSLLRGVLRWEQPAGPLRISWDPPQCTAWSRESGRIGATALNVMTLSAYYRMSSLLD
jgi:hypothetical protein